MKNGDLRATPSPAILDGRVGDVRNARRLIRTGTAAAATMNKQYPVNGAITIAAMVISPLLGKRFETAPAEQDMEELGHYHGKQSRGSGNDRRILPICVMTR